MKILSKQGGFALAVLLQGAAGTAFAQSSLNISGYLDTGVFRDYDRTVKQGTIQRSNLAISGVEDLGGGLATTFRLSSRFELDTGELERAGYNPFFHDESTIGLKGGFGHVRVGRGLTALWAQDWVFDPWYNFNRVASPAWQFWHYLAPADRASANGKAEYSRVNDAIFYDSPDMAGFTLHVSGTVERNSPAATGRNRSASLNYARGPLAAMLAHERNGNGDTVSFAAAKYAFENKLTVMGAYDTSKSGDTPSKTKTATLGLTYEMGALVLKGGYGRMDLDGVKHKFVGLGADYNLSKRTMLYVSLGHKSPTSQASATAYGVGVAHSF